MPALYWHSTPAYHAFYYAGILDAGLPLLLEITISNYISRMQGS